LAAFCRFGIAIWQAVLFFFSSFEHFSFFLFLLFKLLLFSFLVFV